MKKYLLLLFMTFIVLPSLAEHEYIPLVVEGKAWVGNNPYHPINYQNAICEKIIIEGIEYHQVIQTERSIITGEVKEPLLNGYIREEGKKVYFREASLKQKE